MKKRGNSIPTLLNQYKKLSSWFIIAILAVIFSLLCYRYFSLVTLQHNEMQNNFIKSFDNSFTELSNELINTTESILSDKYVHNHFYVPYSDDNLFFNYTNQKYITSLLSTLNSNSKYNNELFIYSTANGAIFSSNSGITEEAKAIMSEAKQMNDFFVLTLSKYQSYLCYYKILGTQNDRLGIVITFTNTYYLDVLFKNLSNDDNHIFIYDDNKKIVFSDFHDTITEDVTKIKSLQSYFSANKRNIKINSVSFESIGFKDKATKLNCLILSNTQNYKTSLLLFSIIVILLLIIIFFLSRLFASIISNKLYTPIMAITDIIDNPSKISLYEEENNEIIYKDIKYITDTIIKTNKNYENLKEEIENRYSEFKYLEERVLQVQIQPHFLMNTLDNIYLSTIELTNGENDASVMLELLCDMLKINFRTKENIVCISDEIEHVTLYTKIQKLRFPDRFDIVWDVDDSVLYCNILRLILQPIIENSIYHGIKPAKRKCTITVSIRPDNSNIVIVISDTGIGMSSETLKNVIMRINEHNIKLTEHIGLYNTHHRLILLYGEEYGIKEITSAPDKGTTVKIVIPHMKS